MTPLNVEGKYDVVVVGGLNSDFLIKGPGLPRAGETLDGVEFITGSGGKGGNQAVAAARLGARVAMVACVGNDPRGLELIAELDMEGVDTAFVRRVEDEATGAAVIMVNDLGQKMIMVAPGANRTLSPAMADVLQGALYSARTVLLQLEIPIETVHRVLSLARAAHVTTVLDAAPGRRLPRDLVSMVDLLRCNASEAEALTGIAPTDLDASRAAADAILGMGAGAAFVQVGSVGDLLVSRDCEHYVPRVETVSIDSTGAGDALVAGLATEIARGQTMREAARFANAAAALATTKLGARHGLPRRGEVTTLLERLVTEARHPL